jgi:acetylornithine/N-succinyldiaminopimelate aminotransferase
MSSELIPRADRVLAQTYKRFPIVLVRGEGCTLWDDQGKSYTDFVAGIAVCSLGHAHPRIADALCEQARKLWHVSNLYYIEPQAILAEMLVSKSFADRVFFCNSGAEANEASIKLARRYFHDKGENDRFRIVTMDQSFHGRTMATLSATGQEKIRHGFNPVLEGFSFVPFNDVPALKAAVDERTCAVLLEPIQGEGGIRCPEEGYLKAVRQICDETGALLIFDEIQTGMGRTGTLFAYEQFGVQPDIMSLAKALGNGLPIGAMLATEPIAAAFGPGAHATTFGGTPIVTAATIEVLKVMEEENIVSRCGEMGAYFKERLMWLKDRHSVIKEVRGRGLMIGMELAADGTPFVMACMEQGYLINCIQENVLRFVPPLVIEKEHVDGLVDCLDRLFGSMKDAE